jgi:hypothetical protein
VIERGFVAHVNLVTFQKRGHRYHERKLLGIAAIVIGHGQDGFRVVAYQDHLGSLIEQLGVGFGNVEAAEAQSHTGTAHYTQQEREAY